MTARKTSAPPGASATVTCAVPVAFRDDSNDGFRLAGGLSDGAPCLLLVAPDERGPAVHDHLGRVDAAGIPEARGVAALAFGEPRG